MLICCRLIAQEAKQISVHDPVMIRQNGTYYIFCTGPGISVWSSPDMKNWNREKPVFDVAPEWAVQTVPGFKNHIWAPDISFHNGLYYLYYSVSAFGKNTSCIGVATNKTLDPRSADFKWTDHGKLIQSVPGKTNWNAIDPNLILDKKGTPFLVFGSFWDGIKMVRLNKNLLEPDGDLTSIPTVASRKTEKSKENPPAVDGNPADAGGNAIEAPFVFQKGAYFYLFASIDYCCKGSNSTYKMIVGRSKKLSDTFKDKNGTNLDVGGGTIVLAGNDQWHGVGHNAVVSFDGVDYLVFHAYDASDNGRPKLRIEQIRWKDGWPNVSETNSEKK
nr:arabinan endo-1,5-alpha-L-arabinosidase [Hufsiella arboris]